MAAGLGFKTFTTGEVLTAANVNGYLMQGILVFASAAARDSAITSPQEGQFAYLKDTNVTTYYTGSAWANVDTTGMTNPMTTTGDTIYSSSGSTPARLGIGSTGNVLTVAGGVPTWAAPAGGGKVLQVVSGTYSTSTAITSTSLTDTGLSLSITPTLNTSKVLVLIAQTIQMSRPDTGSYGNYDLKRGATSIRLFTSIPQIFAAASPVFSSIDLGIIMSVSHLDSPATTSATTYKTQASVVNAAITSTFQNSSNPSSMILMEIGA
jgi:hypothetical protein